MTWSRAFQKCIIYLFLDNFFYYITGFCKTNSIFANLQFFLQILKAEHKSFPMMYHLSYWDIQTWDLEGGGSFDLVFKYPSRDRVKTVLRWVENNKPLL